MEGVLIPKALLALGLPGACRQGLCFVPVILLFPRIWGLYGVLYAQPAADVLAAVVTLFMAFRLHRKLTAL